MKKIQINKYDLYEIAVQDPEGEMEILSQMYRDAHGKEPRLFREDFCASFLLAATWVKMNPKNVALAIDKDPKPLAYGKEKHLGALSKSERKRLHVLCKDVRNVQNPKADIITAANFSGFFFKTRKELLKYLRKNYLALKSPGVLTFDLLGGLEQGESNIERTKYKTKDGLRFTYVWEQVNFNPINHHATFLIHFEFPDGSKIKNAFRYDWRIWSINEIREAMMEAGFDETRAYWEGDDQEGGGDGNFAPSETEENCDSWVAYVVGIKN